MPKVQHPNNRQFKKRQLRTQGRNNMRKNPSSEGFKSSDSQVPCVQFNE